MAADGRNGMRTVFASLLLLAPAVYAADSPANGKTLFEGNSVQPCTACHANVDNRRAAIDPGGDLDFDFVLGAFLNAIATQPQMNQFATGLDTQQKRDIAAYIADVPKARPNEVDFTASNTNMETAATAITFSNAVTAASSLRINSIGVSGSSADFLIKTAGTTCANNTTLQAGQSCVVNVSFMTSSGSTKIASLDFPYSQGGQNVTRSAQLTGSVANQSPPQTATPTGGGGGAFSLGWGVFLLAAMGLRRRFFQAV